MRWMSAVTIEDRISNEYVRRSIEVASIVDKLRGKNLDGLVML